MNDENLKKPKKGDPGALARRVRMPGMVGATSSRTRLGQMLAEKLLSDPLYVKGLKTRLRAGEAPHLEVYLWRLRYGDPPKGDMSDRDAAEKKFESVREVLRELMARSPESLHAISAVVTQAETRTGRLLPMPRLPGAPRIPPVRQHEEKVDEPEEPTG